MQPKNILRIAKRIAVPVLDQDFLEPESSLSPEEKSKRAKYKELFDKWDVPINFIEVPNFMSGGVSAFDSAKDFIEHFKMEYESEDGSYNLPKGSDVHLDRINAKYRPDAVNVLVQTKSNSDFNSGAEWLAHDLFHKIEFEVNIRHILEFVKEDLKPHPPLHYKDYANIFVHWLPEEFKRDAPSVNLNLSDNRLNDFLADIMVHYINNKGHVPSNIRIDYKPVWLNPGKKITPSKYDSDSILLEPRPGADSTQIMIFDLMHDLYDQIRSVYKNYIGWVITT